MKTAVLLLFSSYVLRSQFVFFCFVFSLVCATRHLSVSSYTRGDFASRLDEKTITIVVLNKSSFILCNFKVLRSSCGHRRPHETKSFVFIIWSYMIFRTTKIRISRYNFHLTVFYDLYNFKVTCWCKLSVSMLFIIIIISSSIWTYKIVRTTEIYSYKSRRNCYLNMIFHFV